MWDLVKGVTNSPSYSFSAADWSDATKNLNEIGDPTMVVPTCDPLTTASPGCLRKFMIPCVAYGTNC